ncbi:MAG: 30S ribosomal protein S5 [Candidatus Aenigmatarchaeota archaeon]
MAKTEVEEWKPKTKLGREVLEGKITSIHEIFEQGRRIMEPEIVDKLVPSIDNDLILIGGTPGKGGGIRRTPAKRTARMHKSGRRFKTSIFVIVGNRNGLVGVGKGEGTEFREVIEKATNQAKLNLIPIRRGCGSWECECGEPHSIPCEVSGKSGSVEVKIKPAPKGVGLVVADEIKKFMKLAGIEDIWSETFGQTKTRINLIKAVYNAFKNLNKMKMREDFKEEAGVILGDK